MAEHDFHSPVRLRKSGSIKNLATTGPTYLELRMLDLNPWASIGISSDALNLLRLMAAYFLASEATSYNLPEFNKMNEQVALESPSDHCRYQNKILTFLKELRQFAATIQASQSTYDLLDRLEVVAYQPSLTINARLVNEIQDNSLTPFAIKQARLFQQRSALAQNVYEGFRHGSIPSAEELAQALAMQ